VYIIGAWVGILNKFKTVVSLRKVMATVFWDITESVLFISCHMV